jgi:5-methylthioadenosine/S-adenosylhomocysteine deaminase
MSNPSVSGRPEAQPERGPRECDLLLTGGSVVTVDDERRVLEPGAVAVTGDRIVAVGTPQELGDFRTGRTVDCSGKAVTPGFVDCHNHLFQGLARGLGEGMSLWPWLCEFMWPYAAAISSEEAQVAAALGAIEAVRAGTTAVVDNHYSPADLATTLGVAGAIERVGLRGVVARGIFGEITEVADTHGLARSLFRYSADEELDITRRAVEARPPASSRVGVWPAPINVIYVDQQLVGDSIELARSLRTGWHAHCSEAQADPDIYLEAYGIRPIDWLFGEGLLGAGGTIAHSIWLDDREVERMGETATGAAYNPTSNQYLASGTIRLRGLRDAGAVVGLGTDGPGCGHRQDMFEQMKQSILVQRLSTLDPTVSTVEEAFEMATREGARYLGLDAGVLAPGKLADVVVVDLERPHLRPLHRTVATLAYSARGSDVVMTIVGGEVVYEDGRCTKIDEAAVMEEAQRRAAELVARAGMGSLLTPWRRPARPGPPDDGSPTASRHED